MIYINRQFDEDQNETYFEYINEVTGNYYSVVVNDDEVLCARPLHLGPWLPESQQDAEDPWFVPF